MAAYKQISISLPAEMVAEVERTMKIEQRSRSELMREALRHYFALRRGRRIPLEQPTAAEEAAIARGEAALAAGEFVTLEDLQHDLGLDPH
ncbi:MAG: ribbon-helix-helix protein, CopG family [Alphaproteobacteria bacterium]|nr:ribbon-helix-helix protein, CopG family [Alphaproteobacteria bacterium]